MPSNGDNYFFNIETWVNLEKRRLNIFKGRGVIPATLTNAHIYVCMHMLINPYPGV